MKHGVHHTTKSLPADLWGAPHIVVGALAVFAEHAGIARRACLKLGPAANHDQLGYVKIGEQKVYYIPVGDVDNQAFYRKPTAVPAPALKVLKYSERELGFIKRGTLRDPKYTTLRQRHPVDPWYAGSER